MEKIKLYRLRSQSRSRHTKAVRASGAGRAPIVQYYCKQRVRLVPGADKLVPESYVLESLDELKAAVAAGHLAVLTEAGQVVNLDTFEVAPLPPTPPPVAPPVAHVHHFVGNDAPNQHPNDKLSSEAEIKETLNELFGKEPAAEGSSSPEGQPSAGSEDEQDGDVLADLGIPAEEPVVEEAPKELPTELTDRVLRKPRRSR